MDTLIKQILLLPEKDRKKLLKIIAQSIEMKGEGYSVNKSDFEARDFEDLSNRILEIVEEHPCLIEFDDHITALQRC